MKLYRFELLLFDGTVLTVKFCVGVSLNILFVTYIISEICTNKMSVGLLMTLLKLLCSLCSIDVTEAQFGVILVLALSGVLGSGFWSNEVCLCQA